MKRMVLMMIIALMAPGSAIAAGPYDGAWFADLPGHPSYLSIHETDNGVMVGALLDTVEGDWEAFQGVRAGNTVELEVIYGPGSASIAVHFLSETEGQIELLSCSADPGAVCHFLPGETFPMVKEF